MAAVGDHRSPLQLQKIVLVLVLDFPNLGNSCRPATFLRPAHHRATQPRQPHHQHHCALDESATKTQAAAT